MTLENRHVTMGTKHMTYQGIGHLYNYLIVCALDMHLVC